MHLVSTAEVLRLKNQKRAVFAQFGLFFGKIVGASAFLTWGALSLQEPHHSTQNYNRKWDFLEKRYRAEIWGRFCGPFGTKSIKWSIFRRRVCKIGGGVPPKSFQHLYQTQHLTNINILLSNVLKFNYMMLSPTGIIMHFCRFWTFNFERP